MPLALTATPSQSSQGVKRDEEGAGLAKRAREEEGKKGKGGRGGRGKDVEHVVRDMARLLLVHDEAISSMEGILLRTWIMPSEFEPAIQGAEQGKLYHKQVKENKAAASSEGMEISKLGPPHIYIVIKFLKELSKMTISGEGSDAKRAELQVVVTAFEGQSTEQVQDMVQYFRISKTHNEFWRVRYHFKHQSHTALLDWYMEKSEGDQKLGKGPKGSMVRSIEKWQNSNK